MNLNTLQALATQAITAHQRGDMAAAEAASQQIFKLDPVSQVARNILGLVRSRQGRHDEAIGFLAAAVKADPRSPTNLANHGLVLQAAGRFAAALTSYDSFLKLVPDHPQILVNRANTLRGLGRFDDAIATYDRAIAKEPNYAEGHYNRALALSEMRRLDESLAGYDRAIAVRPDFAAAFTNRGNVLRELGRPDDAMTSYAKALEIDPGNPNTFYNRAVTLNELGRTDEAMASYDQALTLAPQFTPALTNRANLLRAAGRIDAALADYERAIAAEPRNPEGYFNRGVALGEAKRFDEAMASYAAAINLKPDYVDAIYNGALMLQETQRWDEAVKGYNRVLALKPDHVEALNNKGAILQSFGNYDEALAIFDKAIAANPNYAESYYNRSFTRWQKQKGDPQAIRDLERALVLRPDYPYALGDLLHLRMQVGEWNSYARDVAAIDAGLRAGQPVVRPFVYQAISESPADLQLCSTAFTNLHFPPLQAAAIAPRPAGGKIRIGYLSAEFRDQATSYLMAGLFETHDRNRFEVIALDNGGDDGGPMRKRLITTFDKFIDVMRLTDDEAAQRIRNENIDILVNLSGYFGSPRMGIFARRAAPIQVNYLGFPATLGANYLDYIIADRVVIPEAEQGFYSEKVVYLPDSYQVNDSKRAIDPEAPTRASQGLPENAFVFCNFNQNYKLTPPAFTAWMKILAEVDGSVFWMLQNTPALAANLRKEAARFGINSDRLIFAKHAEAAKHLARLALADLFLDSRPYNAHTTASDALWAGLPLITCRGTAFPGRVAASVLDAAGLPELVTENMEDFAALAVKLARDKEALASVRKKLADNRTTCALFDTERFRRHIESAYETMVANWRAGKAPAGFTVG
ncbi:MAG: tetratricopeptide repeat protein [Rhodospirillaceae bacterium]|nr:tetratricopeptide repeat protein [Rhodospirillaceae bacterium]